MDVKEAVKVAKGYVAELFSEEGASNLGLEEVEYEPAQEIWQVTVGFDRKWRSPNVVENLTLTAPFKRSYKVVTIADRDAKIISLRQREGLA